MKDTNILRKLFVQHQTYTKAVKEKKQKKFNLFSKDSDDLFDKYVQKKRSDRPRGIPISHFPNSTIKKKPKLEEEVFNVKFK